MRRWLAVALACAAAALGLLPASAEAPVNFVSLDPTFGSGGVSLVDIAGTGPGGPNSTHEDEPYWIVAQPDGKWLVSGKALNPTTLNMDMAVLRFLPNGTPDASFGWGGAVLVDFVGAHDEGLSLALQTDGKIAVAGLAGRANGNSEFGLVRLNANGSRDTTFGWNGIVMTDFFGLKDQALGVAVLASGKIVTAGYATRQATGSDLALARYNANGSLDTSFGLGGRSTADFWGKTDALYKLAVQPDGKLVGSGIATRPDGTSDFAVARFNVNGSPDNSFGLGGRVATDFFGKSDSGFSLLLQPDGKIAVGGLAFNPATASNDLALARYNANGSIDTGFATAGAPGLVVSDYFGLYDQALWLVLQPDDKIVAIGHARHPTRSFDFALARYNANGTLDLTFGDQGHVTTDFFTGPDGLHAGLLYPNGKLLAVGDAFNPGTNSDDFAFARYLIADPSWIGGVVSKLPDGAFDSPAHRATIVSSMVQAQADAHSGNAASALAAMQDLRARTDGCGAAPDPDDWIIACADQATVRALVDQVIAELD